MKNLIACIILIFFSTSCILNSDKMYEKSIKNAKKFWKPVTEKELFVVLEVENENYISKLYKKEKDYQVILYKMLINDYNQYIKKAVAENLKEFKNINYITSVEFSKLKRSSKKKYSFLVRTFPDKKGGMIGAPINAKPGYGGLNNNGAMQYATIEGLAENVELDTANTKDFSSIRLLSWYGDELTPIYNQKLNKLFCSYADIQLTIRQLNSTAFLTLQSIGMKQLADSALGLLKAKTLIINKNLLNENLTEDEIRKEYRYKYKVVDNKEYEDLLLSKNKDIVILVIQTLPNAEGIFDDVQQLFDPFTEITSYPNQSSCVGKLKREHLKWYGLKTF